VPGVPVDVAARAVHRQSRAPRPAPLARAVLVALVTWGDPLSVIGCGAAGLAFGYAVGRLWIWWMGRPFRAVSPYIPPIVSVRPPTSTLSSGDSDLVG
jgi:hypothetical protein